MDNETPTNKEPEKQDKKEWALFWMSLMFLANIIGFMVAFYEDPTDAHMMWIGFAAPNFIFYNICIWEFSPKCGLISFIVFFFLLIITLETDCLNWYSYH